MVTGCRKPLDFFLTISVLFFELCFGPSSSRNCMHKILTLKAISTVFNWIVVRLFTWNWPGLNKFIKPDQYRISRKSRWLGTCDLCQYCSNTYRKKNTHTHVLIWAVIVLFCSYNSSIHTLVHRHIVAYAVSTCFYDCVVYFSLTNKQINRMKLWKNVFIFQKKIQLRNYFTLK